MHAPVEIHSVEVPAELVLTNQAEVVNKLIELGLLPGIGCKHRKLGAPGSEGDRERDTSVVEPLQIAVEGVQGV